MSSILHTPLASDSDTRAVEGLLLGYLGDCMTLRLAYASSAQLAVLMGQVERLLSEKDFSPSQEAEIRTAATSLIAAEIDPSLSHLTSARERRRADQDWLGRFEQKLKRLRMPPVVEEQLQEQALSLVQENEAANPDLTETNRAARKLVKDLSRMTTRKKRPGRQGARRRAGLPATGLSHT